MNIENQENQENENKNIFSELWDYLRVRKAFWLLPIIVMLILVGAVVIFGSQSGVLSPFIYALF